MGAPGEDLCKVALFTCCADSEPDLQNLDLDLTERLNKLIPAWVSLYGTQEITVTIADLLSDEYFAVMLRWFTPL